MKLEKKLNPDQMIKISSSFGIASLLDHENYICEQIKISQLSEIFEVKEPGKVNWEKIEQTKHEIGNLLIQMPDSALYSAKKSFCSSCGYNTTKKNAFKNETCPECGSNDVEMGRRKYKIFDRLSIENT